MPKPYLNDSPGAPGSSGASQRGWLLLPLAAVLLIAVTAGSLMPTHYKVVFHTHGRFHAWIHVIAFGTLAFVAARTARALPARILIALGCLVFGCVIEIVEAMTYRAGFEWRDVLTDALGITVATVLAQLLSAGSAAESRLR